MSGGNGVGNVKVVNLTGHPIRLGDESGHYFLTLMPQGRARIVSHYKKVDSVAVRSAFGGPARYVDRRVISERNVVDLPEPDGETIYVVSGIVAAFVDRDDVWAIGKKVTHGGDVEAGRALIRYTREKNGGEEAEGADG